MLRHSITPSPSFGPPPSRTPLSFRSIVLTQRCRVYLYPLLTPFAAASHPRLLASLSLLRTTHRRRSFLIYPLLLSLSCHVLSNAVPSTLCHIILVSYPCLRSLISVPLRLSTAQHARLYLRLRRSPRARYVFSLCRFPPLCFVRPDLCVVRYMIALSLGLRAVELAFDALEGREEVGRREGSGVPP